MRKQVEFKRGDRVALRGFSESGLKVEGCRGRISAGAVAEALGTVFMVELDSEKPGLERRSVVVLGSQCRPLKRRHPRRRFWIAPAQLAAVITGKLWAVLLVGREQAMPGDVEFVEVRRKR